jgi:hypothetical protein
MKTCTKCNQSKSEDQFRVANKTTRRISAYCMECQRKVSKVHYAANRESHKSRVITNRNQRARRNRELYIALKGELRCSRCPENHIAVLDFHHTDPKDKDRAVSNMMYDWSFEAILKEMNKCEVLCSNCHRKHHYEEKAINKATHSGESSWT